MREKKCPKTYVRIIHDMYRGIVTQITIVDLLDEYVVIDCPHQGIFYFFDLMMGVVS